MTTRAYAECCWDCGEAFGPYRPAKCDTCDACANCCDCEALFDADELGIDPEVDAERFERA